MQLHPFHPACGPGFRKIAEADLPSRFGHFRVFGFEFRRAARELEEAIALKMGDLCADPPLVYIHSECLAGDVFDSLRCDCRSQIETAMATIAEEGRGLVIYRNRTGRGFATWQPLRPVTSGWAAAQVGCEVIHRRGAAVGSTSTLPIGILHFFGLACVRLLAEAEDGRFLRAHGIEIANEPLPATASHPSPFYGGMKL